MSGSVTRLPASRSDTAEASDQALVGLVQSLPRGSDKHNAAALEYLRGCIVGPDATVSS